MSDMIDGYEDRWAFVERENPVAGGAWHGKNLGHFYGLTEDVSAEDMVEDAGGNFPVYKAPLYAMLEGGRPIATDGHFMVMRGPAFWDERDASGAQPLAVSLGSCQKDFVPVSNLDLARMLDRKLSEQWKPETVGIMENGSRIFIVLKVGEWSPLNLTDEHTTTYLMTHHDKRPGGGLQFTFSDVRTVCNNTVQYALESAMLRIELKQTGDFVKRLETVMDLGSELQDLQFKNREMVERLALRRAAVDEVKQIIGEGKRGAYPDPKQPGVVTLASAVGQTVIDNLGDDGKWITQRSRKYELELARMQKYRLESHEAYERICDEFPKIAGTAYAVVQAVAEHADHREGRGDVAMSRVFGDRADAKRRALSEAVGLLAGGN